MPATRYIGRLAPSPTGQLHLGHARTFLAAAERARLRGGKLYLRNDDLDGARCRPEFTQSVLEDLRWLGLSWAGPLIVQSERLSLYREALARLHAAGLIFPCDHSRKEIEGAAASAPHEDGAGDEPLYPLAFRPDPSRALPPLDEKGFARNWRFRVPDGERVAFVDGARGPQSAVAGRDFGDFLVWRKDGIPSYQLACAVDDAALGVTEVVRGADLIRSTFRQILLIRALGGNDPGYYHCPLMIDAHGERLAKRHRSLALSTLRRSGIRPDRIREICFNEDVFSFGTRPPIM